MVITKPSLKRIISKINTDISISSLSYEEIRYILNDYLTKVLKNCILIVEYCGKKTVSSKHVYPCLSNIPASISKKTKRCSVSKKDDSFCFDFPKETFKRLVRDISNDFLLNIKFSDESFYLLQMDTENYIKKILNNAILITINSNRTTLFPKDINLSKNISDKNKPYVHVLSLSTFVSFNGIEKVFRKFQKKINLNENIKEEINTFLNVVTHSILSLSNELMEIKGTNKIISENEIKTSVKLLLPHELSKHAIYFCNKSEKLDLSVENTDFTDKSIHCLTSVLEYLLGEIFSLITKDKKNLSIKNIIDDDEELLELSKNLNIWFNE